MSPSAADPEQVRDLAWLVQPRWAAAAAYVVALVLAQLGAIPHMQATPVLVAAALTVATNLWAHNLKHVQRVSAPTVGLLLLDATTLTVVLFLTGGASNPLSSLYLLPIALAAVMLDGGGAWIVTALAVCAFGALFLAPEQVEQVAGGNHAMGHEHHGGHAQHGTPTASDDDDQFGLHLRGMWVAFTLTAVMVTYFLTRITTAMGRQEGLLTRARTRTLRAERVASLASLAGSTAHELGTPIASISLAASEMQGAIERGVDASQLAEDAKLVHEQAHRCREILDHMLAEAGETVGEAPTNVSSEALVEDAVTSLTSQEQARVDVILPSSLPGLLLPRKIVTQALHNLLRNAIDASQHDKRVRLEVQRVDGLIRFVVDDDGVGMTPDALAQAMDPFVSTKPGRGKGLGLFLTQAVAERLGGQLSLTSTPERGTQAVFEISAEGHAADQANA